MDYRLVDHSQVPRLAEQLAELSNLAFAEYEGAPTVEATFIEWYLQRPGSSPAVCFAALRGDQMVANVLVAIQPLNVGGEYVSCGIVDTVATHPDHRQQGLARALMALAHQHMRLAGAQAAVLYTNPQNHPYRFYGRLGYYTRARAGMLTGQRPAATGSCFVRPLRESEGKTVRELVNAHYGGYEGFAQLDETLWQWHRVGRPAAMPAQVVVAEREGRVVGTAALAEVQVLLAEAHKPVTVLSDAVYPDGDCLRDLLALAPQSELMTLQALDAPERADLEEIGFVTSVGEASMILPFSDHVRDLMHGEWQPWYVMVESVVGV